MNLNNLVSKLKNLPESLARITSGGRVIREIDGLRFMAIMPVMFLHMSERFERNTQINFVTPLDENVLVTIIHRGGVGVSLFFIISGFILALPFANNYLFDQRKVSLKKYYVRRLTRLEPPYIFWMSVFFVVFMVTKGGEFFDNLLHYFASITYTHVLFFGKWSIFNPPSWTLELEVQFYILAPFLTLLFFKIKNKVWRRASILGTILIILLFQFQYSLFKVPYYITLLAHIHLFIIGFFFAEIYLNEWSRSEKVSGNKFYDLTGLLAFCMLVYPWSRDFFYLVISPVFLSLFFYSTFKGYYTNKFFTNRWIMFIGSMCYTTYLIHLPLAEFVVMFTKYIHVTDYYAVNLFFQLLIFIPIAIVISIIGFAFVERPFMDRNLPGKVINFFTGKGTKSTS